MSRQEFPAKVLESYRITIPTRVRTRLGINVGDEVDIVIMKAPQGTTISLLAKKQKIDDYLSDKEPADYGAVRIGDDDYDTTGLIMIRLDKHGLWLSDGTVTEHVSDKSVEEIIETIEEWAQTFRDMKEKDETVDKCLECGGPATHPSGLCRDCYQGKLETEEAES